MITSAWIPVIRRSGRGTSIAPHELLDAEDPPARLAWPRSDLDSACLEFLIGLFAIAAPPSTNSAWARQAAKPDVETIRDALARLEPWMFLDGPGGQRAFQDYADLEGETLPLERLLIDAPGENTSKKNTDLFVKRGANKVYSQEVAAMMLITFQAWAPAGGAGNRTSLRGGGPMCTLVEPAGPATTLFDVVWANVPLGSPLHVTDAESVARTLPWTAPTPTSESAKAKVHAPPSSVGGYHPGAFFGTPRRIRLVFTDEPGECAMTGRPISRGVAGFIQRPYGIDYGLWRHPCTPYYRVKVGTEPLPVHPRAGRFGYSQYLGILLQQQDTELRARAACVDAYLQYRRNDDQPARLLVAGWAMSNMSALDYIESRLPLPRLPDDASERLAEGGVKAAELIAWNLASAVAQANAIAETDKGLPAALRQSYYALTEGDFARFLGALATESANAPRALLTALASKAMSLFDEIALPRLADAEPEHAATITAARHQLFATLRGTSKSGQQVFTHLGLALPELPRNRTKPRRNISPPPVAKGT